VSAAADALPADEHLATMADAVGAAVARQLGAHLTELMKRFDGQVAAAHRAADRIRAEVSADVDRRLEVLALQLENQRHATEDYQRTMLESLESRVLADLRALHDRLDVAEAAPLHVAAGTAAAVVQLRATIDARMAGVRAEVAGVAAASAEAGVTAAAVRDLVAATNHDVDTRLAELAAGVAERTADLAERLGRLDEHLLDQVREELSTVVGEATLARIEMDRLTTSTDAKLDRHGLRMAEIEASLADHMDTSAAVQLERLDELERAVAELDPDQCVRRQATDPTASRAS
jgi:hypothetical protein